MDHHQNPRDNVSYLIDGQHPPQVEGITFHNENKVEDSLAVENYDYFRYVLYSLVVPCVFGIISITGIVGNILVIHVIRSRRKMRTVTNLLLLNLAVADLSFVIICPPFTAYQMATSHWPFPGVLGDIVCKLMHYLLNVTVYVTIYTLVVISIIRWLTIVHNTATVALRTMTNTIIIIMSIWFVMLGVNVPIIFSHGVQDINIDNYTVNLICDNYGYDPGRKIYGTFFVFAYVLPLSIIAGFSFLMLSHIKAHQPTMFTKSKSYQRKKQATRLIILVIVIFAIFWLPVHIHLLVAYFTEQLPDSRFYTCLSVFWYFLAYLNSCINPLIYNYASKEFRDSFTETVLCRQKSLYWDKETSVVTRAMYGNTYGSNKKHEKEAVVIANGFAYNDKDLDIENDEETVDNV